MPKATKSKVKDLNQIRFKDFPAEPVTFPDSSRRVTSLPLDVININPAVFRVHVNADIDEMAKSIHKIGLINPIAVIRDVNGQYHLTSGMLRYLATQRLGAEEIDVIIKNVDTTDETNDLLLQLSRIDENYVRPLLNFIYRGELLRKRDEILTRLGIRAKAGDNQHTIQGGENISPPKTTRELAAEAGLSERTAQREKQLSTNLTDEAKDEIVANAFTKADALMLSRLTPDEQQEEIQKLQAEKKSRKPRKKTITDLVLNLDNQLRVKTAALKFVEALHAVGLYPINDSIFTLHFGRREFVGLELSTALKKPPLPSVPASKIGVVVADEKALVGGDGNE